MTYETTIGSGFVVRTRGRPFKCNTGAGQSHEWPPNPPITTLSLSHENSPIAMHTYIFWDFNKNGCGPFCHCMQLDAFFQLLIYNVNCAGFSLPVPHKPCSLGFPHWFSTLLVPHKPCPFFVWSGDQKASYPLLLS